MEALVVMPIRCTGNGIAQGTERNEEEVHEEPQPDKQSCFSVAPHLAYAVVDDVRYGKHQQSAGDVDPSERYLLCLKHVCRNKADAEEHAEKHKQHAHGIVSVIHNSCFV